MDQRRIGAVRNRLNMAAAGVDKDGETEPDGVFGLFLSVAFPLSIALAPKEPLRLCRFGPNLCVSEKSSLHSLSLIHI